ncbi:MAG TPA: tRNA (guanosine(37)-N1)-methyltransferase TrmD [Bacteriovoracaceae bacterium]|nr:tRNA (guanosine(37)-N1)-methyltransferase TrmD [Bacteriovoracaceae bacterium]
MIKRIFILTIFPEYFRPLIDCGITGSALRGERSQDELKFEVHLINIRDFSKTNYKSVDDTPYGGGPGMVMRADILRDALIDGIMKPFNIERENLRVIYTSPRGVVWNNQVAREFALTKLSSSVQDLVFIAGRYEGVDERFLENYVDEYYSVGDFVLTGGELAIMTIIDSAIRFVPGILGNKLSSQMDSFEDGFIEHPQYTRPSDFEGKTIPEVLMSGHHKKILEWQKSEKLRLTQKHRPDLLK